MGKQKGTGIVTRVFSVVEILGGAFLTVFFGVPFFVELFSPSDLGEYRGTILILFFLLAALGVWLVKRGRKRLRVLKTQPLKAPPPATPSGKGVAVRCPNCGGSNMVPENGAAPCEYCGTMLQG